MEQGGLAPGGLNFDCKVRRESTALEDMFISHIGEQTHTPHHNPKRECELVTPLSPLQVPWTPLPGHCLLLLKS